VVEVTLTGPQIRTVTAACGWNGKARSFECTLRIPAGVKLGHRNRYKITAEENVGTGFAQAPATGHAVNPLTVTFKAG
jgi:hypothetical protein